MSEARLVGLIAGNGAFPLLWARAARKAGVRVVAVAHREETDPALEAEVEAFSWVYVGQIGRISRLLRAAGVREAAMVGGIGKAHAFRKMRPDLRALRIAAKLRHFNDDALLRGIAEAFEEDGIRIIPSTEFLAEVLAPKGTLGRVRPTSEEERDVAIGREVAEAIGRADVGQTVVVHHGHVVAVEAVEGTDACIRRAGALAGAGVVVVKRCKPGQDERFDLPTIGPRTIEVLAEVKGRVLAVEAGRTVVLDGPALVAKADAAGIAVVAA